MPVSANMDTAVLSGMNEHMPCLILKSQDYREADSILTVLTDRYGKTAFLARGVRKMSSHNAGNVQLYSESDFLFDEKEGRSMFVLKRAECLSSFRHLKNDLKASVAAGMIAEGLCSLLEESERIEGLYEMIRKSFSFLDQGRNPNTVLCTCFADLLDILGFSVNVDSCSVCGKKLVSSISIKDGGFLCRKCADRLSVPLRPAQDLKRFRLLVKGGTANFDVIEKAGGATEEDVRIMVEMIRMHAGSALRSYEFYKRI